MIRRIITISFIGILTSAASVCAQEKADSILTVEQCVELALKSNRAALNARVNVDASVYLKREALSKYFPEISAAGMSFWANHDVLQYNLLNLIELGIINKGKVAGIQAMQPIFTGGQIVNGNKLAAIGEEVAKLRQSQTDDNLRLTTETLYWKLVTLTATKATLTAAIMTLDTLDAQVQAAVDAGLVTRNDLLKVQLKRNTYRAEMVDLDNGINLVKMLLSQYIGRGISGDVNIEEYVPDSVPELPYHLYLPQTEALYQTADYRLLEKNVEAKNLEKRIEIGKNLPTVAFGAGWYYHDLLEQNNNFGALQIGISVPLSAWWGGAYAIKRKSAELTIAKNELEDYSEKLSIGMQNKWNNFTAAHRKMEIEAEGISQSAENLRLNTMYYEAGMSTIADLLEAEASHKQAKERFIAAYGDYRVAQVAYLIATGR